MPLRPGLPIGSRSSPTQFEQTIPPTSLGVTQSLSTDLGMTKRVVASVTFVGSPTNQLQAAATTFQNFAAGDTVMVEGANLNNGTYLVLSTDASTQLTVAGGLHAEGPVANVTVRAI